MRLILGGVVVAVALWVSFMSMIKSANVINVPGGSTTPGTQLTLWPTPLTGATSDELWEWQPDPNSSGYFLIVSNINGLVIEIRGGSTQQGSPIQTGTQNLTDAQLWQFVPDPGGSGYSSIQSKLSTPSNMLVINVAGGSAQPGTPLILWPAPPAGPTPNELWAAVVTLPMTPSPAEQCQSWIPQLLQYANTGHTITAAQQALWGKAIEQCGIDGYLTSAQVKEALQLLSEIRVLSPG